MVKLKDILDFFEGFAPVETAMDFDNVGLLVGDPKREVKSVMFTLDITPPVVDEACALECDLIISHHPVIFKPLSHIETDSAVYYLAKNDIAAICMHTNLDLSEKFGVNTCLAEAIGLKKVRRSNIGECLFIGELPEKTDIKAFAAQVKEGLGCEGLRYTEHGYLPVKKVAVCSGSGGDEIYAAAAEGANVLVTGEIKHNQLLEARRLNLGIIDAGHFKTEHIVIKPLRERMKKEFPDLFYATAVSDSDYIKYL